ncbi:MAG: caspase family protein [Armatimonadota bacterium]
MTGRSGLLAMWLCLILAITVSVLADEASRPEMVPQIGHSTHIKWMAYSPDGSRLVTTSNDGQTIVWNLLTRLIEHRITGIFLGPYPCIIPSISANNAWLLLEQGEVYEARSSELWSLRTGRRVCTMAAFGSAYRFSFHHDDAHLWAWCAERGSREASQLGPDTTKVAAKLLLIDLTTLKVVRTVEHLTGRLVAISPDDAWAVTAIYTPPTTQIPPPSEAGKMLGQGTSELVLWDLATGKALRRYSGVTGWVNNAPHMYAVRFSTDGTLLAAQNLADNSPIWVWNTGTGVLIRTCYKPKDWTYLPRQFAFTRHNTQITSNFHEFATWSLADTGPPQLSERHFGNDAIFTVAYRPDGAACATTYRINQPIRFHDTATTKVTDQLSAKGLPFLHTLIAQPGGTLLAAVSYSNQIPLWDMTQGRVARWLSLLPGFCTTAAAFSPDGRSLVVRRAGDGQEVCRIDSPPLDIGRNWNFPQALTFTPDGAILLVASATDNLTLWNPVTGKYLGSRSEPGLKFLSDVYCWGKGNDARLVTVTNDGLVIVWKLADVLNRQDPVPLAFLLAQPDGRWLATTPGGYYDCSLEAANAMVWRQNGMVFPFDMFAGASQRPDILAKSLAGADITTVAPLDPKQAPPMVSFVSPAYGAEIGRQDKTPVTFTVKATALIARLECTVNGQPLPSALADRLVIANPTKLEDTISLILPMPLEERRIRIRAVAYDTRGSKSAPAELALFRPGAKTMPGNLWVLAVGINRYPHLPADAQLNFAAPDATAFAKVMQMQAGKPYVGVSVALLTDEKANLSNLKIALRAAKDLAAENDTVIIYVSGHGLQDADGQYYFPTYDADLQNLPGTALSWQDFTGLLREMRANRLLVLADTCQSGEITGKPTANYALRTDKLNPLAQRMVLVACRGDESSLEKAEWGGGAFTKALLEAIAGKADKNKDSMVTYQELADYVPARVVSLTKGRQHPQFPFLEQFESDAVLARVVTNGGE